MFRFGFDAGEIIPIWDNNGIDGTIMDINGMIMGYYWDNNGF